MNWLVATLVASYAETSTAKTLVFDVEGWPGHKPGQHVDVRLTAEDGYSAQRSYSIATPVSGNAVALTIQTVDDGEVSPYLTGVLEVGEQVELRGPIGGWFVWETTNPAPVLLVAGGSGIVPLMSMIRARVESGRRTPFRLVYSVRSPDELLYGDELRDLPEGIDVALRYTRKAPQQYKERVGRLAPTDLVSESWSADRAPACFVCGPTGFVEAEADMLVADGHLPFRIKTERFGPSGS